MEEIDSYRMMIYYAHAVIHIYEKDIIWNKNQTVWQFTQVNKKLIERVVEEGLNVFNYELSSEQINRAVYSYMYAKSNPQSVFETEAYKPKQ